MGTVRFLLALCVVVTHAPGSTVLGISLFSGVTAVQSFYVISGFLITMILNERAGYLDVRNFYFSRYLRLWPTYILIAGLSLALFKRDLMFSDLPTIAAVPEAIFITFSNLTLFFQDWFLFLRFDDGHLVPTSAFGAWPGPQLASFLLVPQCWTLGVELTFYAIAPFVCRRLWSIAALFAFGMTVRFIVASFHPAADPWTYRFAPSEMMMFAAGGLAYFAGRSICPRFPQATKIISASSLAAFAAITFGSDIVTPFISRHFRSVDQTFLITYWPVLFLMVITVAPLFYGTRSNKVDQLFGELSYPMYVSHVFVWEVVAIWFPPTKQSGNLLYVICVIGFSLLLVYGIILPVDRVRKRFGARVPLADILQVTAASNLASHEAIAVEQRTG